MIPKDRASVGYFDSTGYCFVSPTAIYGKSKMTAIGIVTAKWGVLMAADGRMILDNAARATSSPASLAKETEHAKKIFLVVNPGRTLMYALAGSIANDNFSFDLRREFQDQVDLLSSREFSSPYEYVSALGQPVATAMTNAHHFPKSNGKSKHGGWKIADIFLGGAFGSSIILVHGEYSHSQDVATFHAAHFPEDQNWKVLYGSEIIHRSMYDQHGAPVKNSPFATYAINLSRDPLVSEAKRYAVGYIEACCSDTGRKLDPKGCKTIGGRIHVATVKPRSGFQWIIEPLRQTEIVP